MSHIIHIENTPVLDLDNYFESLKGVPRAEKLRVALAQAGCSAWDQEGRYIKSPSVALVGLGGLKVTEELLAAYRENRTTLPGASAGMSYLNSGNKPLDTLYDTVVDSGHFSVMHTVSANLLVAGVSVGVENEFNSQRDILHLSRVTVARTGVQQRPPVVVAHEDLLAPTKRIVELTDELTADIASSNLDSWEQRNLLYPASKATLFLATASLRNFQKLVSQKTDRGKEAEYRASLELIERCLASMWPEIFIEE